MEKQLHILDEVLKAKNPECYQSLQPGLSRTAIDELLAPLWPLRPPEALYRLYQWHNGHSSGYLIPHYRLLPLNEAMELWNCLREYDRFPPLLEVFHSDDGSLMMALAEQSCLAAQILEWIWDESRLFILYDSLNGLIDTALQCYSNDVYFFEAGDPGGFLDTDTAREQEIRARFNPNRYRREVDAGDGKHDFDLDVPARWPEAWQTYIGYEKQADFPENSTPEALVKQQTQEACLPLEAFGFQLTAGGKTEHHGWYFTYANASVTLSFRYDWEFLVAVKYQDVESSYHFLDQHLTARGFGRLGTAFPLERLPAITRQIVEDLCHNHKNVLLGDPTVWKQIETLENQSRQEAEKRQQLELLELEHGDVIQSSMEAFSNKDYARVCELLEPFEAYLDAMQKKKLNYARKKKV